jgi:adenosylmethionine-8-amino-7-oxononanoate aminotransferase
MAGIELVNAEGKPFEFAERMGFKVCMAARASSVLLRPLGNVIVLMPPLSLSVDEAKRVVRAVKEAIEATLGGR